METATYGYAKISSIDQNEGWQIAAMDELNIPAAQIFTDKQSGKDFDRPAYIAFTEKISPPKSIRLDEN